MFYDKRTNRYIPYRRPRGGGGGDKSKEVPDNNETWDDNNQDTFEPDDTLDADFALEICVEIDEYDDGDAMEMEMAVNFELSAEIETLHIFDESQSTNSLSGPGTASYKNNEESEIIQDGGLIPSKDFDYYLIEICLFVYLLSSFLCSKWNQ